MAPSQQFESSRAVVKYVSEMRQSSRSHGPATAVSSRDAAAVSRRQ